MQDKNLVRAFIFMVILVAGFIATWELYLRSKGIKPDYDDGDALWSDKRAMVYEPQEKATVFIGSSRNKYDIDIPTWESLTGDHAIQLAIEGNSPLPVLDDLANDKNFKGKLVVDVTEGLFFSNNPPNTEEPKKRIEYYKKQTPAQKFGFKVNHVLESGFVFLDKKNFSLNALLDNVPSSNRKGVFSFPIFPMDFGRVTFERQDKMTDKFLADTSIQNRVKKIWQFFASVNKEPPASGAMLDSFLNVVKKDVDKIKARGGQVLFVRTPSSGPYWAAEKTGFPRQKYWEKILSITNCPGIHFEDYPATSHFECPEFSHLKPSDAVIWTKNLVGILQKDKGWTFPNKSQSLVSLK